MSASVVPADRFSRRLKEFSILNRAQNIITRFSLFVVYSVEMYLVDEDDYKLPPEARTGISFL